VWLAAHFVEQPKGIEENSKGRLARREKIRPCRAPASSPACGQRGPRLRGEQGRGASLVDVHEEESPCASCVGRRGGRTLCRASARGGRKGLDIHVVGAHGEGAGRRSQVKVHAG
jgi:hypothetical protein